MNPITKKGNKLHGLRRWIRLMMAAAAVAVAVTGGVALPSAASAAVSGNVPCTTVNGGYGPINRDQMIERARSWLVAGVSYSQSACYGNEYGAYRQDCSGFVAMVWGLSGRADAYWTGNITSVAYTIARADLKPGDALWRHDSALQHMAIFVTWADAARTQPVVYEEFSTGHTAERRVWSAGYAAGFTALRYNGIVSSVFSGGNGHVFRVGVDGSLQYSYHYGWNTGSADWSGGMSTISSGGWDRFITVFAMDSSVYGIDEAGNLFWYRWTGSGWAGCGCGTLIGSGWTTFKKVIAAQDGIIYGITYGGALQWYRHTGWVNGTSVWAANSGSVIGSGWESAVHVVANLGQIDLIASDGTLRWYTYTDPYSGNGGWTSGSGAVIGSGWWFAQVFGGGYSALYGRSNIYALTTDNFLLWYGHQSSAWSGPAAVRYGLF